MEHERSRLCGGTNRIIHVLAVLGRDALKAPQLVPNWCYGGAEARSRSGVFGNWQRLQLFAG
jgi:hypothetical protein